MLYLCCYCDDTKFNLCLFIGIKEISKRDQTIIQHLRVDKILPLLDVGQNVKDDVNNKVGSEEKAEYLLSKLGADRKPLDDAMAAVQPELFKRVHGREPSHEERGKWMALVIAGIDNAVGIWITCTFF